MNNKSKTKYIQREIYPQVKKWLNDREIIAIAGPRQSGKTTILNILKDELKDKNTIFINFEDSEQLSAFQKSPQEFIKLYIKDNQKSFFLLDEFQYVKNAGKVLKLLYDIYSSAKFIITGSSSLKIRQIASFLVGRVIFFNLYPLSFAEYLSFKDKPLFKLWQNFNQQFQNFINGEKIKLPNLLYEEKLIRHLDQNITFGGYPAVAASSEEKKGQRLLNIIETYIDKDIVKLLKIGNYLEFRNLTKILSSQIGNLLNYSSLNQDTSLAYRELKKFTGVLEKTFVIKLLSSYYTNKITEIRKAPKVYFIDLGLRNKLIDDLRPLSIRQDKGALIENFVFSNLYYRQNTKKLQFWRTKQKAEVDFILSYKGETIPIEVKFQQFNKANLTRSYKSFLTNYKPKKGIILTKNYADLVTFEQTKVLFFPVYFV